MPPLLYSMSANLAALAITAVIFLTNLPIPWSSDVSPAIKSKTGRKETDTHAFTSVPLSMMRKSLMKKTVRTRG